MSWSNKRTISYKSKCSVKNKNAPASKRRAKAVKSQGYIFPKRNVARMNLKVKPIFDGTGGYELDSRGRIKGSYIDGIFIPD